MPNRKFELGKGLKALISDIDDIDIDQKNEKIKELASSIAEVDIDQIEVNPFQPRNDFDPDALRELSQSIAEHGLIQPITVRSLSADSFQLISGERRLRASKMAGLKKIPAYIRVADDQGMLELALIENLQRENLNALEIALGYQRLIDECQLTHQQLSERIGKTRTSVTNYLRLLKLPPTIKNALRQDHISMGHARVLAGLDGIDQQLVVFDSVLARKLSVRQTEVLAKELQNPKAKPTKSKSIAISPEWRNVETELMDILETSVKIKLKNNGTGEVVLHFDDVEHFNEILDIIRQSK